MNLLDCGMCQIGYLKVQKKIFYLGAINVSFHTIETFLRFNVVSYTYLP